MAYARRIHGLLACFAVAACSRNAGGPPAIPNPAAVPRSVTPTWGAGFTEYANVMAGSNNSSTHDGNGVNFGKKTARYANKKRVSDADSGASWNTKLLSVVGGAQVDNAVTVTNDKKKSLYPLASNQSNAVSQDRITFVSSMPSGSTVKYVETISIDPKTVSIPCTPKNENQTIVFATSGLSGSGPISVNGKCVGKKFAWVVGNTNNAGRKASIVVVGSVGVMLPIEMTASVTTKQTTNGRNGLTTYHIKLNTCVTVSIKTKGVKLQADSGHDYSKCPFN